MEMSANYKSTEAPFDVSEARRSITNQMFKGFVIAMVTFFGPVLFILVIYWVGLLLPPESKEADDPTPDSFPIVMEAQEAVEEGTTAEDE
ncbi:MAG: RC-LH1 core complex protein PufX [Pseudomonadota bacterium]